MAEQETILDVRHLVYSFRTYGGVVHAVRDVSFSVRKGEILGIVGESGCGKSVTAQSILRLNPEPPGFAEGGEILYKGRDVLKMKKKELRDFRTREIGFVFQDPMTSLNPTMRIGEQIEEVFIGRTDIPKKEVRERAHNIMKLVGISDVDRRYKQYPHELSGGMKQRVMIAIALVSEPDIIICDEPTTSLDVTIEAQILDLLKNLRDRLGTSIILITHDLGVIAKICDRVAVMYGGEIVENGDVRDIFYRTAHPYTSGLLHSIARLDMDKNAVLSSIEGTPPDLFAPPKGCPFAARCQYAMKICSKYPPARYDLGGGHESCCWLEHPKAEHVDLTYHADRHAPYTLGMAAGEEGCV
jgi:oligopeptide transport system ATP-binding protein